MCGVIKTFGSSHSGRSAGSGSASVTSSAARSLPVESSAASAGELNDRPAGDVHHQRPRRKSREHLAVDDPAGLRAEGDADDHDVGGGGELWQARQRGHTIAGRPGYPGDLGAEGHKPRFDGRADGAIAHQQHTLARQGVGPQVMPGPAGLLRGEGGELAQAGKDQADGEFRGSFLMAQPVPVAQDRLWRHRAERLIHAAAQALHHLNPRQLADQRDAGVITHVGQAIERDLAKAGVIALPVTQDGRLGQAPLDMIGDPIGRQQEKGHCVTVARRR